MVLGLALVAGAAVFALLPVKAPSAQAMAECNPLSISRADAAQTPGSTASGSSYVPAIVVWLDPASATPTGDPSASVDQSLCQSAAVSELTPGFVLGGIGLALLIFAPIVVRYVATGQRTLPDTEMWISAKPPGRGWLMPLPGWYDEPGNIDGGTQRWWDGRAWTEQSRPKSNR